MCGYEDAEKENLMTNSNNLQNRQSSRMSWYDYGRAGYYFVTICTQDRFHAFGRITDAEIHLSSGG
jgi:hypothetical protein